MEVVRGGHSSVKMGAYVAGMELSSAELVTKWQNGEGKRKWARITAAWNSDARRRVSNREFILALEQQFLAISVKMHSFKADVALPRLATAWQVHIDTDNHHVDFIDRHGVIQHRLETDADAWSRRRICWASLDQGPRTWPAMAFLCWVGFRWHAAGDIFHRLHNDVALAVTHAKLSWVRKQFKLVLSARAGPFRSGAHHSLLVLGATLMRRCMACVKVCGITCMPMWQRSMACTCIQHSARLIMKDTSLTTSWASWREREVGSR